LWTEFFKFLGTKLQLSNAYHPLVHSKLHMSISDSLRCIRHPKTYVVYGFAEFLCNTSFHAALRCSTFKALYGVVRGCSCFV
jgi:hypothetical protein